MPLLTHSALLRALGWSLFNSLWQMSLLWASFHLFLLIFNRLPARSRHGLALILLMLGVAWSVYTFFGAYSNPATVPHGSQWLPGLLQAPAVGGALARTGRWLTEQALPWGSSLYLIILSGLLVRYFRHYIASRQITRSGLSKISPEFRVFAASTARQMGIRASVGVYLSTLVDVPVTLGFLKPVILLPVAMLTHLRTEQVEAILVHELAHIRRKDYLLNLGVTVIELLFFFNPFTRMLVASLKKEREHCCDDQVLEFRYDPHAYVSALLSLARQNRQPGLALAAIGGGGDRLLLQRARKMLQQKDPYRRPKPRSLFFLFPLLFLVVLSIGFSTGIQIDPARPDSRETPSSSGQVDRNQPLPELVLYTPTSIPPTGEVLRAPLVNKIFVRSNPVLVSAPPSHGGTHHRIRRLPADPAEANAITDNSTGPGAPFVPASSFSFQYTDTVSPKTKLAWMELMTEKSFRIQVIQLQAGLQAELTYLRDQQPSAQKAVLVKMRAGEPNRAIPRTVEQMLKEYLQKQIQLQQEYQNRMDELQRQWLKMGRRLTIVYI